jgi:hypothetical protein
VPRRQLGTMGTMPPRPTLLAAAVVAALLSAGAAWVSANPAPETAESLAACLPATVPDTAIATSSAERCLVERLERLIEQAGPGYASQELTRAQQLNKRLNLICHGAAHTAGMRVLEQFERSADILTAFTSSGCEFGLLHGALDAYALRPFDADDWAEMVQLCDRIGEYNPTCGDALGHVAWTVTPQLPDAALRCDAFSADAVRMSCTGGVLMRMAAPQDGVGTRKWTPEEIVVACLDWPLDDEASRIGCAEGVGFAFSYELYHAARLLTVDPQPGVAERFEQAARAFGDACRRLGPAAHRYCVRVGAGNVHKGGDENADLVSAFCAAADPERRIDCQPMLNLFTAPQLQR